MKITPLDVDQRQFQRVFRGCDPDEVHTFLDLVSREMEELIRENNTLKEEIRTRDGQLIEFRKNESQLREALVAAGRMTDEIKTGARKEAELILAEAELQAERILASSQERVVSLSEESQELRRQKTRLVSELRATVESHARLLDTQESIDREAAEARARRAKSRG